MGRVQQRRTAAGAAALCLSALLLGSAAPKAPAAPTDRETAVAQYQSVLADMRVGAGWTGSVETCTVGTESAKSLDATRHTVNVLRSFAGLDPVVFDPEKNRQALAAALMMRAAGDLSHNPGPSWPCYSERGRSGAATSNLALGASGAGAIVLYVNDSGVPSLGHRLWVLDPDAAVFGSGSTGSTNALAVVGSDDGSASDTPADSVIAWPPEGWVPWGWIFTDWSVTIGNLGSDVDLGGASVQVSVNGSPAPVTNVRPINNAVAFGKEDTLAWNVGIPVATRRADAEIVVNVSGVKLNGADFRTSYAINAFAASSGGAPPKLVLRAKRKQKPRKRLVAKVKAGCDQPCELAASGKVVLKGNAASAAKRKVKLKKARASLPAAGKKALKLKASKRNAGKLRRALKRGARGKAKIKVRAVGNAGNRTTRKLTIKLKR